MAGPVATFVAVCVALYIASADRRRIERDRRETVASVAVALRNQPAMLRLKLMHISDVVGRDVAEAGERQSRAHALLTLVLGLNFPYYFFSQCSAGYLTVKAENYVSALGAVCDELRLAVTEWASYGANGYRDRALIILEDRVRAEVGAALE